MSDKPEIEESTDEISSISDSMESSDEHSKRKTKKLIYSENEEEESSEDEFTLISPVQRILGHRMKFGQPEYYCKFKDRSYRECEWLSIDKIQPYKGGKQMIKRYHKMYPNDPPPEPFFDKSYTIPERIIGTEKVEGGLILYIVKWTNLDYEDNTKEEEQPFLKQLISKYKKENKMPSQSELKIPAKPNPSDWKPLTKHEKSKSGKEVRSYQLEGLNFMVNSWYHNKNAILADEMGLGKTCQGSLFLDYLHRYRKIRGPYIVLAPLSTIPHWEREILDWTNLKPITYYGSKSRRTQIKKYELFFQETDIPKFNVLITTYEYAMKDAKLFEDKFVWQALIIDEAHRLKNFESKLTQTMHSYKSEFKLLLSGTPLQNNTQELWSLLNFLDEKQFGDMEAFQQQFGTLNDTEQVEELKSLLKPLMLRRLKGDVEKNLPPLEEVIIECGMTQHQKAYYKAIYSKNMEYLSRGAHASNTTNLMNISMELRKVCNHPYLITGAESQILIERKAMFNIPKDDAPPPSFENESLIRSAGKMILLDKLLQKLYKDGHKVLIFSQMTRMLDIIQDFLMFRGYQFERLDGRTKSELRQPAIDRFNAPGSKDFVFMLCTKAGGLGINLTAADIVIIYDSDWNPQNDIQATARCHRIGQTKSVTAYRFITTKSYEKKMFDTASLKLGLDNAILEANKDKIKQEDMEKLLRLGAYYAFEENDDSTESINEEDIDSIISRSKVIKHEAKVSAEGSTFSKASFTVDEDEIDVSAPDFWKKYMPEVKEDEIDIGGTIAERRRFMRERSEDKMSRSVSQEIDNNDDEDDNDQDDYQEKVKVSEFQWTKKKITLLQQLLLRFGWGRWHAIYEQFDKTADLAMVKAVCHVFIKVYISGLDENNPVLNQIYASGVNQETDHYEAKFYKTHKAELDQLVSTSIVVKANRLTLLFFINSIIGTCKNPPEDLEIPGNIQHAKPAEWWTTQDDKMLLYGVWKYGFQCYSELKFSKEETFSQQTLNNRLKAIVNTLKSMIIKHNENKGVDLPFSASTLHEIRSTWSRKEHQHVQRTLNNYGFPDPIRFIQKANLNSKTPELVTTYVQTLLKYCEDLEKVCSEINEKEVPPDKLPKLGIIPEHLTVGQAHRIRMRTELFEKGREVLHNKDRKLMPRDRRILEIFDENGFYDLEKNEEIIGIFGTDGLDGKLSKRVQQLIRSDMPRSSSGGAMSIKTSAFKIRKDENGNTIFPINASPNLRIDEIGKVVYDRPGFHNDRYLYTDGYHTERLYQSFLNLEERIWYHSTITDDGGENPVFRVYIPGTKYSFEGSAPSRPWLDVIKAIEDKKKEEGLPGNRSLTISGPDCYGLTNPIVASLMMELPNADKCPRYRKPKIEIKDDGENLSDDEQNEKGDEEKTQQQPNSTNSQNQDKAVKIKPRPVPTTTMTTRHSAQNHPLPTNELKFDFSKLVENKESLPPPNLVIGCDSLIQKNTLTTSIDPLASNKISNTIESLEQEL